MRHFTSWKYNYLGDITQEFTELWEDFSYDNSNDDQDDCAPSFPEGVDDENTEKQQAIAIWIVSFLMKDLL